MVTTMAMAIPMHGKQTTHPEPARPHEPPDPSQAKSHDTAAGPSGAESGRGAVVWWWRAMGLQGGDVRAVDGREMVDGCVEGEAQRGTTTRPTSSRAVEEEPKKQSTHQHPPPPHRPTRHTFLFRQLSHVLGGCLGPPWPDAPAPAPPPPPLLVPWAFVVVLAWPGADEGLEGGAEGPATLLDALVVVVVVPPSRLVVLVARPVPLPVPVPLLTLPRAPCPLPSAFVCLWLWPVPLAFPVTDAAPSCFWCCR